MADINEAMLHIGMVPEHCQAGLLGFIEYGHPVGGFLTALLSNDLKETFARADEVNGHRVRDYVQFLYSYAPVQCWGSKEAMEAWQLAGGLTGLKRKQEGVE